MALLRRVVSVPSPFHPDSGEPTCTDGASSASLPGQSQVIESAVRRRTLTRLQRAPQEQAWSTRTSFCRAVLALSRRWVC